MKYLIISDIFGLTKPLLALAKTLNHAQIIDPYQGKLTNFDNEPSAYNFFINNCGHDEYFAMVSKQLKTIIDVDCVIAFSAGATALWRYIAMKDSQHFRHKIAFYGGQIRHYLDLVPAQELRLIFPIVEQHFDVNDMIKTLAERPLLRVEKCRYHHGFMNQCSAHFSQEGYQYYLEQLRQLT